MASTLRHTARQLIRQRSMSRITTAKKSTSATEKNILTSVYKDIVPMNCTVNDFIWQNLDRWPDKTATVCAVTGHGYTYAQTHRMSVALAASLRTKLKLQNDDKVAVILPNIPEYPCTILGILQAGCVASMMNPAYKSHEYKHQIDLIDCKAIVTTKISYREVIEAVKLLKTKIPIILVEHEDLPEGAIKFAEFAEDFTLDTDCLKAVQKSPKDLAVIPFSSGTTGLPKGVELTHSSVVAFNQMISDPTILAIGETTATHQSVIPGVLPFFHIFGFNCVMMNQMHFGCKIVTMPYFKADLFLQTITNYKTDVLFIVPPMVLFLGKHPVVKPEHLKPIKSIICGAASLSAADAEAVIQRNNNIIFRQGYGLTETNGGVSVGTNKNTNHSSVGFAFPSCEIKIADLNTQEALGPGKEGEIWFRSASVMSGYHKVDEDVNKAVLTEDGWFKTGDIGKYDDQKYLYVTDRLKELIKVKGFQVAPAELEAIIRTHPKILDCAVLGMPDPVSGEKPHAFLVPQPGQTVQADEVLEFVNNKVTAYKSIKTAKLIDVIPKNAAGKIMRKELKEKYF